MNKYGVLLVSGLMTHQENYAEFFALDPRCKLIAVTDELDISDQRVELNKRFADEMNLQYIPNIEDALERDDVDIVSVCAEHERRGRVAVRCAKANKHIYLDKPMACSIQDADAIVSAVEASGVKSQVFSFVHQAWVQSAKQAIESNSVGELLAIHCDVMFAKGYPSENIPREPRKQDPSPKRFTFIDSKRELRATGVYSVGLIRWLTNAEVKSVFCVTGNYFFEEHLKNDVEDFGLLAMTFDNDIIATVSAGRIGYTSHPSHGPMRIHIVGTKGIMLFDAYSPRVEVYTNEPHWIPPQINPNDPMGFWSSTYKNAKSKNTWIPSYRKTRHSNDVGYFIDCIDSDVESEVSARDGAAQVEVLMAGYISASKREIINLPIPRNQIL
ncbi:TPA: Gfo/Idh/MocA family oxidoreductase [bacterium]|nr:Gfo/Idh/MocA family oxidoreductase [bacterium]